MSSQREQEDAYTKTDNPIPTSLFLSRPYPFYVGIVYIVLFCIVFSLYSNSFEHNKDVWMGL